ncbi:MAG: hypothetical protein ACRD2A_07145, partial [Vicinamibacterales bacterium]
MPPRPRTRDGHVQSWATFLRNHAGAVLACDFFVVVTATFQQLYVFVVLDIATRRVSIGISPTTRRRNGRSSSFGMACHWPLRIGSSSTIATGSLRLP